MAQYSDGSVSVTQGSSTVTGSGTAFVTGGIQPGHILLLVGDPVPYVVSRVNSETSLTVNAIFATSRATVTYIISKDFTPNRNYPLISSQDTRAAEILREALLRIDSDGQAGIVYKGVAVSLTNTPPGSPAAGSQYIIGTAPTGVWAGQAGKLATWSGTAWSYAAPANNWYLWVTGSAQFYIYQAAWVVWSIAVAAPNTVSGNLNITGSGGLQVGGVQVVSSTRNITAASVTVGAAGASETLKVYGTTGDYGQLSEDSGGGLVLSNYGPGYMVVKSQNNAVWLVSAATMPFYADCGSLFYWRDADAANAVRATLDSANGNLWMQGDLTLGTVGEVNSRKITLGNGATLANSAYIQGGTNGSITVRGYGPTYISCDTSSLQIRAATNSLYLDAAGTIYFRDVTGATTNRATMTTANGNWWMQGNLELGTQAGGAKTLTLYSGVNGRKLVAYTDAGGNGYLSADGYLAILAGAAQNMYLDCGGNFIFRDKDASNAERMNLDSATGNLILQGNMEIGTSGGGAKSLTLYSGVAGKNLALSADASGYTYLNSGGVLTIAGGGGGANVYLNCGGYVSFRDSDASNAVRMMLDTANGNLSIGGALQRNPASPVTVIDANGNGVFNTVTAGASTSQYLVGSAVQIFDHDFYTTRTDGLALQFRFGRGTNSNGTLYTRWYKGDGSVNQAASLNHSNGVFNTNGGLTIADIPIVDASRNATFNRLTCSLLGLPASNATPADNDIWVENGKLAVRIAGVTKYATLT